MKICYETSCLKITLYNYDYYKLLDFERRDGLADYRSNHSF